MPSRYHRPTASTHHLKGHDASSIRWFRQRLMKWFAVHGRDFPWRASSANNYTKVVSEVLLQRTRAEVIGAFLPKFLRTYPSWRRLGRASQKELGECLKPLGLWRRRAISLHRLGREMAARNGRFPKTRDEIEDLPNVGQYIANAVLLFCHNAPEPLLDVNMARVLERFFGPRDLADIRHDPYLQFLARQVVLDDDPVLVNWALLDHATLVCKIANPLCDQCPVRSRCMYANRRASRLPAKRRRV